MRNLLILLTLLVTSVVNAQNGQPSWSVTPASIMGFSENLGRYDAVMDEEVIYYAESGSYRIYFSKDAFVFAKAQEFSDEEFLERYEKLEHGKPVKPLEWYYFKVEFSEANLDAEFIPNQIKTYTRNFQNALNPEQTLKAKTYDELTFKNIYPNVDVLFELPEEGGLKYSFVVHPGGDPEQIQLNYVNTELQLDVNGDLNLSNVAGDFIDHAPVSSVDGKVIESAFVQEENQVHFTLADYDKTKELIIDPWVDPVFPGGGEPRKALEISYDDSDNCVIVISGDPLEFLESLFYYDNSGILMWEWSTFSYGDVAMNPETGITYLLKGSPPTLYSFDPTGTLIEETLTGGVYVYPEVWRLKYNNVLNELATGDGGVFESPHITTISADLASSTNYEILPDPLAIMEDVALLEADPIDGSYYFLASTYIGGSPSIYGNILYHVDGLDPMSILWETPTLHVFEEIGNATYSFQNGVNGIACGENFVYTYDGNNIVQYDKVTGTEGVSITVGETVFEQYGIDVDICGSVYVGTSDSVLVFNDELVQTGAINVPNSVYDLVVGSGNIFVAGLGFVTVIELEDFGEDLGMFVNPSTCTACDGSASYFPSPCITMMFEGIVWSPTGSTDLTATDLCAGWHYATTTWTDIDGGTVILVDSVEVVSIDVELTLTGSITDLVCYGECTGEVSVNAAAGTAPYTYTLDGVSNETGLFTGLCAGTYDVDVVDANGCDVVLTVTLDEPPELILEIIEQINVTCAGLTDGLVTVNAIGGTGSYLYDIGGVPIETGAFIGLGAGTYIITVEDDNGCTQEISVTIFEPAALTLDIVSSTDILCNGDNTGAVEVIGGGGVGAYEFSIDGGAFSADPVFTDLIAGEHTIIIRDENGCEFAITVTLTEPAALDVTEFLTQEVCEGDCNGAIDLFIVGGVSPYSFSIDDCVTSETFAAFTDLCPADYPICVEDANGCRFNYSVTVNPGLAPVDPIMVPIGPFCADAAAILIIAPDLGDLSGPGVVAGSFDPSIAGPGIHTITNTIVNDCGGGIATMEVLVNPLPNVVLLADETSGCIPFQVAFENIGETGVSCEWNFGDGTIVETCDFIMHTYTNPGVYDVSLTVTDANGCVATAFYENYIEAYELPIANFKYAPVEVTTLDRTVDFTDLSAGADSWIWTFDSFGSSADQNPSFLFPDNEGTYEIIQIAISPEGCRDTMVQTIVVIQKHLIFVPNVITPDGNTMNEVFLPYFSGIDVDNYHLTIYNRWGELIFESYDLSSGWNGTFSGEVVQDGVYIWHILVGDIDTELIREYHGHVSVLR